MVHYFSKPNLSIAAEEIVGEELLSSRLQALRAAECGRIPSREQPCHRGAPFPNGEDKKGHRSLAVMWLVRNGYFLTKNFILDFLHPESLM